MKKEMAGLVESFVLRFLSLSHVWGAFEGELGSHSVYLCGLTFDSGPRPSRYLLSWVLECSRGSCKGLVLSLRRVEVLRSGTQWEVLGHGHQALKECYRVPAPF